MPPSKTAISQFGRRTNGSQPPAQRQYRRPGRVCCRPRPHSRAGASVSPRLTWTVNPLDGLKLSTPTFAGLDEFETPGRAPVGAGARPKLSSPAETGILDAIDARFLSVAPYLRATPIPDLLPAALASAVSRVGPRGPSQPASCTAESVSTVTASTCRAVLKTADSHLSRHSGPGSRLISGLGQSPTWRWPRSRAVRGRIPGWVLVGSRVSRTRSSQLVPASQPLPIRCAVQCR
jgi:hypothetical protein